MGDANLDEMLGIVRCARCGRRLDGEVECPFCSMFPDPPLKERIPAWVYLTACFLTSPLSIYYIISTDRLGRAGKIMAATGVLFWTAVYLAFA